MHISRHVRVSLIIWCSHRTIHAGRTCLDSDCLVSGVSRKHVTREHVMSLTSVGAHHRGTLLFLVARMIGNLDGFPFRTTIAVSLIVSYKF